MDSKEWGKKKRKRKKERKKIHENKNNARVKERLYAKKHNENRK